MIPDAELMARAERADRKADPMTDTARIRWGDTPVGTISGHVGSIEQETFAIWKPPRASGEWVLESDLPGLGGVRCYGDDPEALKAEAERWLAGFVSSLGAIFPDEPTRPSRAWHADWAEVDRDQGGNAILRHKPTGGMYKILPAEEC